MKTLAASARPGARHLIRGWEQVLVVAATVDSRSVPGPPSLAVSMVLRPKKIPMVEPKHARVCLPGLMKVATATTTITITTGVKADAAIVIVTAAGVVDQRWPIEKKKNKKKKK